MRERVQPVKARDCILHLDSGLAGRMNLLFRSLRANLMLAVWTSLRVSPRANRVARKRSPGLDWRFVMTLHYRLATCRLKRKRCGRGTRVIGKSRGPVGGTAHEAWESKMGS
jgi:hypothetical protein